MAMALVSNRRREALMPSTTASSCASASARVMRRLCCIGIRVLLRQPKVTEADSNLLDGFFQVPAGSGRVGRRDNGAPANRNSSQDCVRAAEEANEHLLDL